MTKFLIYILPFVLSCIPGISLGAGVKLQAYDFYSLILLPFVIYRRSHDQIPASRRLNNSWFWFSVMIILSTFLMQMFQDGSYASSYMKGARFFFPLIICKFLMSYFHFVNKLFFIRCCILSMLICPIIGIYGYVFQIPALTALQDTILDGNLVVRAGSFWQDSGIFGFVCSLFSLVAVYDLFSRWNQSKNLERFSMIGVLILNLVGIVVAFSRMGGVVFIVGLCYLVWRYGKRKSNFFVIALSSIFLISALVFAYVQNIYPALNQNIDKLLVLSSVNSSNVDSISSSRTVMWGKIISGFFEGDIINMLFGYGYRTSNFWSMADNGFLYVLVSSGFVGLLSFVQVVNRLIALNKKNVPNVFFDVFKLTFIGWMLAMMFADVLTYVPTNIMLLTLPLLGLMWKSPKKG